MPSTTFTTCTSGFAAGTCSMDYMSDAAAASYIREVYLELSAVN